MSQSAVILPGSPLTGASAAADMNAAWATMISKFSGTTAPTLGPGGSGGLVEGQDWLDTSVTPNVWRIWSGTAWLPFATINGTVGTASPPLSYRNILSDNGGFEVWQRGAGSSASFAVPASTTQYTADRWYIATNVNQASVISAVAGLTNQSNLALKYQRNNGQTGTQSPTLGFPLDSDEIARIRGRFVTLSFWVKTGANFSATVTFVADLVVGTGAVGKFISGFAGTQVPIQVNIVMAPSAGPTFFQGTSTFFIPLNTTQAEVFFANAPIGTAGADDSYTVDDVQLEIESFASPFERVPFEKSLLGCKRHFWKTFLYGTAPVTNAGANTGEVQVIAGKAAAAAEIVPVRHPVSMRVAPAITTFNPSAANAQVRNETAAADCSATGTANLNTETVTITATGSGGTAVGDTLGVHLTVDAGI